MKALITVIAIFALSVADALQISKDVRLQHLSSIEVKARILDGRLKLPDSVIAVINAANPKVLRLTGEDKDVRIAEKALAAIDSLPRSILVTFEITVDGKTIGKPSLRVLAGQTARVSETSPANGLGSLSIDVTAQEAANGEIQLRTFVSLDDFEFLLPTGIQSGDCISFSSTKASSYVRWSRAGKTLGEYPVLAARKELVATKMTVSFAPVAEP